MNWNDIRSAFSKPHAGEDGDAAFLGWFLISVWREFANQAVDTLFDEVVFLVVDVGRAEIDVVGESVDAG